MMREYIKAEDIKNPDLLRLIPKQTEYNKIHKSHHHCPICGQDLYVAPEFALSYVCDGNTVFMCAMHHEHKFWKNAREMDVLHLSQQSSSTNFHSDRDFKKNADGEWIEYTIQRKEEDRIAHEKYEEQKRQREEYYKTHPEAKVEDEKHKVRATCIPSELVSVAPMDMPCAVIPYLEYVYPDAIWKGKKPYRSNSIVWKRSVPAKILDFILRPWHRFLYRNIKPIEINKSWRRVGKGMGMFTNDKASKMQF